MVLTFSLLNVLLRFLRNLLPRFVLIVNGMVIFRFISCFLVGLFVTRFIEMRHRRLVIVGGSFLLV